MKPTLEIEVDNDFGRALYVSPLKRSFRGRLNFEKLAQRAPSAIVIDLAFDHKPIPGEILGIDENGMFYLREPLHEDAHRRVRTKLVERGFKFQDERTEFPDADFARCINAMKRAVDAGIAKVVKGKFPAEIPVDPDSLPPVDPRDAQISTLVESVTNLTEIVGKLVARVGL
jgi:hypothetical protein